MLQTRKRNYKRLVLSLVLVILLVVGMTIMVNILNNEPKDNIETVEEKKQENEYTILNKDEEVGDNQKPVQYEGDDPNESEELTGVVTYAGVNDNVLMVRVNIDQYITEGVCNLTLERSGDTIYTSIVSLIGDVSASTCEGFDIPIGGLGGGKTNIIINLNADGRTGTIRGEADI